MLSVLTAEQTAVFEECVAALTLKVELDAKAARRSGR